MEKLIIFLVLLAIIFLAATLGGFIVWLVWPIVIPNIFPGLVENGIIAGKIDLWIGICTSWLFAILIKANQTNNNKKD